MLIDAHVHFWKYHPVKDAWITSDMKVIQHDFLPEDLLPLLKENNIDGCMAVQAGQSEEETNFLLQLAAANDHIKGIVGWVDLSSYNVGERLSHFSAYKKLKGFRHIVQAEPEGFLLKEDFLNGIKALSQYDYSYDVLVFHHQLNDVLEFVNRFPEQRMIIDHCAKPGIKNKEITEWGKLMKAIARQPNISCKLSGLLTEAAWNEWRPADIYPYLDTVFEAFGTNRLLFGSDWPVILLSGRYAQWKDLLEKYMENFEPDEKQKVFGNNAIDIYNL